MTRAVWRHELAIWGLIHHSEAAYFTTILQGMFERPAEWFMADIAKGLPQIYHHERFADPHLPRRTQEVLDEMHLSWRWHAALLRPDPKSTQRLRIDDKASGFTGRFTLSSSGKPINITPTRAAALKPWLGPDIPAHVRIVQSAHEMMALMGDPRTSEASRACEARRIARQMAPT